MKCVVLNYSKWSRHIASVHREGCKDIERDMREHWVYRPYGPYDSLQEALDTYMDADMIEQGYTLDDVKVHNCCKRSATKKEATTMAVKTLKKQTAREQGFPAVYLGPTGNFKPGMDARAKSDLNAAVMGERTGRELHRFTKPGAAKLLAKRGW